MYRKIGSQPKVRSKTTFKFTLLALAAAAAAFAVGDAKAAVLYNVNFNNDTVGSTPTATAASNNTTDVNPSYVGTGSNSAGTYTAVTTAASNGFTSQYATLGTTNDGGTNLPLLQFQMASTIMSGPVTISWDSEITSYTPPSSGGAETDLTFRILNPSGQTFLISQYTYISGTGAAAGGNLQTQIQTSGSQAPGSSSKWTVNGGVDHFSLTFNLSPVAANNLYTLSRNGSVLFTGTLGGYSTAGLEYLQIFPGYAVGAQNGQFTAGIDNVVIATPEPTTVSLVGVGGLGMLLLGKRRRAARA